MSFNAPEKPTGQHLLVPLAAATTILAGQLVARNAAGNAVLADDAAGLIVLGRAEHDADNSAGSAAAISIGVKRGCFQYTNSATNAVDKTHVGRVCYIEDEVTVADSAGTNSIVAGIVVEVDDNGVWVDTRSNMAPATAPTFLSTNGTAAAASANLSGLSAETEKIGDDVRALRVALLAAGIIA